MQKRETQELPRGEIRALTGLRGVAACYVVLYHMLQDVPGDGAMPTIIRHGYIAVDLFFVLSGFVLAVVHGADRFDRAGYAAFLRKRIARIYPLYAAVTLAVLAIEGVAGVTVSPARLVVNAALLQGWGVGTAIVAPSWSLSAECAAYLAFPALVLLVLRGSWRSTVLCAVVAFATLATISIVSPVARSGPLDLYQADTAAPLLRCLGGFVLGLVAFRVRHDVVVAELDRPQASLSLAIGLAILLAWRASDLLLVALMVPMVIALTIRDGGLLGRLLASPPLRTLGVLSFSIYLVHFPIREWLRPSLVRWLHQASLPHPTALATLVACATTLAVARLTYRLIERPARSMVRTRFRLAPHAP